LAYRGIRVYLADALRKFIVGGVIANIRAAAGARRTATLRAGGTFGTGTGGTAIIIGSGGTSGGTAWANAQMLAIALLRIGSIVAIRISNIAMIRPKAGGD